MSTLAWSDLHLTGHPEVDETHREFAQLIRAIQTTSVIEACATLAAAKVHCKEHFSHEEDLMRMSGYPDDKCHAAEHRAVLRSVSEVQGWWQPGRDLDTVHRLGSALAEWFVSHTAYLDSALAQWVLKKQYGGVPVVVRRSAVAHDA